MQLKKYRIIKITNGNGDITYEPQWKRSDKWYETPFFSKEDEWWTPHESVPIDGVWHVNKKVEFKTLGGAQLWVRSKETKKEVVQRGEIYVE